MAPIFGACVRGLTLSVSQERCRVIYVTEYSVCECCPRSRYAVFWSTCQGCRGD